MTLRRMILAVPLSVFLMAAPSAMARGAIVQLSQAAAAEAENEGVVDFKGMGFGVGIGFSIDTGSDRIIQQAQVINGIVRVTESRSNLPRMVLESHYFWVSQKQDRLGWGPYVAVQTGSNQVIEAISAGFMLGLRRTKIEIPIAKEGTQGKAGSPKVSTSSFNIGVGAILDSHAKVLRDGIVENVAVPTGEEGSLLTREDSRWGFAVLFSFAF